MNTANGNIYIPCFKFKEQDGKNQWLIVLYLTKLHISAQAQEKTSFPSLQAEDLKGNVRYR